MSQATWDTDIVLASTLVRAVDFGGCLANTYAIEDPHVSCETQPTVSRDDSGYVTEIPSGTRRFNLSRVPSIFMVVAR